MQIKILITDERLGIKSGEVYEAERYRLDPEKISLIGRIPDGYDPECNQYRDAVAQMIKGVWHRVEDGIFVPISE